jgi:hypothetical protein
LYADVHSASEDIFRLLRKQKNHLYRIGKTLPLTSVLSHINGVQKSYKFVLGLGIGIGPLYATQSCRYSHLKTGAEPAAETWCNHFKTLNYETSPKNKQQY